MTNMVFLTDGDYHHGTKCPETKLEIKMTETDISKVLIEGEYATIQGVKYKRVEEPKTLYNLIWEGVGKKVGYGVDCDVMTNKLMDIIADWLPPERVESKYDADYNAGWNDCLDELKKQLR